MEGDKRAELCTQHFDCFEYIIQGLIVHFMCEHTYAIHIASVNLTQGYCFIGNQFLLAA